MNQARMKKFRLDDAMRSGTYMGVELRWRPPRSFDWRWCGRLQCGQWGCSNRPASLVAGAYEVGDDERRNEMGTEGSTTRVLCNVISIL